MNATRVLLVAAVTLAACGGGRTTAATQPSPKAFNPAASDPKALALVDGMLAALGGAGEWEKVKQIQWQLRYTRDGKLLGMFTHAWDRWNGRHRFEDVNVASLEKAEREGKPEEVQVTVGMYDLFDHDGKGYATFNGTAVDSAARDKVVDAAYKQWESDSYRIGLPYKLKDPGVVLNMSGQVQAVKEHCKPACDVIKVTFAPEVGTDTWYVSINTETHLPDLIEKEMGQGRLGFGLTGWTAAKGSSLKFPSKFENLGMSEVFEIKGVVIGEPDDELYIPQVQ